MPGAPSLPREPWELDGRTRRPNVAEPEPGDEQWPYTHAELVRMDNKFRERLLRAFKRRKESRQAAANQIAAPRW
jgi:hypothetical protein